MPLQSRTFPALLAIPLLLLSNCTALDRATQGCENDAQCFADERCDLSTRSCVAVPAADQPNGEVAAGQGGVGGGDAAEGEVEGADEGDGEQGGGDEAGADEGGGQEGGLVDEGQPDEGQIDEGQIDEGQIDAGQTDEGEAEEGDEGDEGAGEDLPVDEVCDGVDSDFDDAIDEGLGEITCGVGECEVTVPFCVEGVKQECEPNEVAEEVCNGLDDDCDGETDETLEVIICGVGACEKAVVACDDGVESECDPEAGAEEEECNGFDDDCDGEVDEDLNFPDSDGDGWLDCPGADCNDEDPHIHPGVIDVADDGVDADCNTADDTTDVCVTQLWAVDGGGHQHRFGASVAFLNGPDGPEVLVGAPGAPPATRVSIYTGAGQLRRNIFVGEASGGHAVANIGDYDEDGDDDFAVGAPMHFSIGPERGMVNVFRNDDVPEVEWTVTGTVNGQRFGWSIALLGDSDGDGEVDIAIGAPGGGDSGQGQTQQTAQVRIFMASEGQEGESIDGGRDFGFTLLSPGDLDGDGLDDLMVGQPSPNGPGQVHMFSNPEGLGWDDEMGSIQGEGTDQAGLTLAAAGLREGADYPGFLWGGYSNTRAIARYIVRDQNDVFATVHVFDDAGQGYDVSVPGDVTGDGTPDFVLARRGTGSVKLYSGKTFEMLKRIQNAFPNGSRPTLTGGDLDGDGRADVVVGAPDKAINGRARTGQVRSWRFHRCE